MSSIKTLLELLVDELKDLYHAENQLVKALPKMAKAASDPDLKAAFTGHLAETKGHVERLAKALKILGVPVKGKTCHAMEGLVEEGGEAIETKGPAAVRDANLIGAAQRVEHYEIAAYGTAKAFAGVLGEDDVVDLLQATLDEEGAANDKLSTISGTVNIDALHADTEANAIA
jgi:ferritin-like metal-binding protein YciE